MALVARPIGACWGFDTTTKMTSSLLGRIAASLLPGGFPVAFILRYVSLGAPNFLYDISPSEADLIATSGVFLGLVQHVEFPHWAAGGGVGALHGAAAAAHARAVGYPQGADLGVDMEGLGNPGALAVDYLTEWLKPVQDAGFNPEGGLEYEGYDDGILSMAVRSQLYQSGVVRKVWSDYGHREPLAGVGFVCVQHAEIGFAGTRIDPDEARIALDGAQLVLAGIAGDPNIETAERTTPT